MNDSMTDFEMPALFCPIELVQHPQVDLMEKGFIDWMDRLCLAPTAERRQELIDIKASVFAAAITPWAPTERQQWLTNWLYWYWVPDRSSDVGDSSRRTADFTRLCFGIDRAISSPGSLRNMTPTQAAAAEGSAAFQRLGTTAQFRRWRDAQRGFLFGLIHQVANSEQGCMPDVDEYLLQRQITGATLATVPMLEIVSVEEIPPTVMESPKVRALTEMSAMLVGLDNDIYSHPMEQQPEGNQQNIINVLAFHQGLTKSAAIADAVALRDRIMLRFLQLSETVSAREGQPLQLYVTALRNYVRANLHLGQNPRYHQYFADGPETLRITETTETPSGPLPYPSISWWWTM
ncbi:terpene synthase family protein [Streptomyces sp. NBC_01304]|uniref:terpene synthase family protein n=1 Tax=Streptomyces sp. NBC_01304 TaxID=2903818 RepID=UPI002E12EF22|nr:terpene synthase family protein [Streptomyces sp. NBC_01304]